MSDDEVFWSNNPLVLVNPMYLHRFFPSEYLNTEARMNSIMRLSIYIGIALSMVRQSMTWMLLPVVSGLFTLSWMYRENPRATEFNMGDNSSYSNNKYKKYLVKEIVSGNVTEYTKQQHTKSNKKKGKHNNHRDDNNWIDTNVTSRIYEDVDTIMQKTQEERAKLTDKYSKGIANSTKFARKMMKLDQERIKYNKQRFL